MVASPNPRRQDIGTPIELTITSNGTTAIDISTATVKQITLQDPNGTETVFTATFTNSGTDGKMQYTTAATTDLGVTGIWLAQGYVEMGGGKWHSSVFRFRVDPNLDEL